MDGDTLPNSGTRSATVGDSRGDTPVRDSNQYSGATRETQVYNGSSLVTDTVTDPWSSAATATHAVSGLPSEQAFHTGTAKSRIYTPLASGATRETEKDATFDAYGRTVKTNDKGDVATTTDDLCTTTSFADNTTAWILNKPAETSTVAVDCGTTPVLPDNAVSDTLNFYDNSTTLGAAPSIGDLTSVQKATSYTGSTPSYATVQSMVVDQYGRATAATDADNRTTHTAFTPATGAQPTQAVITDPLSHTSTTTYDPLRNLPLVSTDPAGYVTTQQYDALGRLTAVYKPGRAAPSPPNLKYSYTVSNNSPSVVDTYTLDEDDTYRVSETLYDGQLRAVEVQTQTPDNGRDIADTLYNTDGWVAETTDQYFDSSPVSTTMVLAQPGKVPSQTSYTYDGAGRMVAQTAYSYATKNDPTQPNETSSPTARGPAKSPSTSPPRPSPAASTSRSANPAAPSPPPGSATRATSAAPPTPPPAWKTSAPASTTPPPAASSPPTRSSKPSRPSS